MEAGNTQFLGEFSLTIDEDTLIATFGGNISIPANAAPGPHPVAFMLPSDVDPACLTFTVTAPTADGSATDNGYSPDTTGRLPETGAGMLLPAAGLAIAGSGLFFLRRRKQP